MSVQNQIFVVLYTPARTSVLLFNQQPEAVMLQLDQYGNLLSWSTPSGHIIPPRTLKNGILVGGAQFHAPHHGIPNIDDPAWEGLVATSQSHLKQGEKFLDRIKVETVRRREVHHFASRGFPSYPWLYTAAVAVKEFPVTSGEGSSGLMYGLTTTRQETCSVNRPMPYRAALQTYFSLKEGAFVLSIGGATVVDSATYQAGHMVLVPLATNKNVELVTGNRHIAIVGQGVDHLLFIAFDQAHVCIELVYGEKHDKYLAPGEAHQLACGLVVTHD